MKAFILAAGLGTRLRPLTEKTPKPLIPVCGKPLLAYHLENLRDAGVRELVINVHWLGDQIKTYVGDGSKFDLSVRFSEEPELLDTGGGITKALPFLGDDPFLLINGDVYLEYPLAHLLTHKLQDNLAHLVMVPNPLHNQTGDFSLNEGKLERRETGNNCTYTGLAIIDPRLLHNWSPQTPTFALLSPLLAAAAGGQLSGELFEGIWEDAGTIDRLQALEKRLQDKHSGSTQALK